MSLTLKPKVLKDVVRGRESVFGERQILLNLGGVNTFRVPLSFSLKVIVLFLALSYLVFGSVAAPTSPSLAANVSDEEERRALEAQLRELELQIDEYENQILSYQKQSGSLKEEIARLNSKIAKLNLQIKAINLTLAQLDKKIGAIQSQISTTERVIDENKKALQRLVQNLYEKDRVSLLEVFLKNLKLSDFWADLNNIMLVQNELRATIGRVIDLRNRLAEEKNQFALARADAAALKDYRNAQIEEHNKFKEDKKKLLEITRGQESKYQALLKQTKESAAQIRKRIFKLLGGGELSFEEAYEYAKLASSATAVRPALILAVLDRESALGRNVGRCSYKTAMSPDNQKIFLDIVKELNIDPDSVTVSCPNADGVYGGAMGPAQFIPSTWVLYRERVSSITGNKPSSPWNNADAFVATALYLKDAGAANASVSQERIAAARYYAGSRWRNYLWTYGEAVISRARSFQEDIDTING